jgi:hypothetical protein
MHSKAFKSQRSQTWKDVLVDFDPVREFLIELEVDHLTNGAYCRHVLVMRFFGSPIIIAAL